MMAFSSLTSQRLMVKVVKKCLRSLLEVLWQWVVH
jgi:hypothetical protein